MSTAFFKIVGAVIDALQAEPPVCDRVERARVSLLPEAIEQAISVQWEQALPQQFTLAGAPIDWQTRLTVDCFARSVRDSGDVAVDPLLQAVYERLAQNSTLGGLVGDLRVAGIEAENTSEGKKTGWVRLTYVADHSTDNDSLE